VPHIDHFIEVAVRVRNIDGMQVVLDLKYLDHAFQGRMKRIERDRRKNISVSAFGIQYILDLLMVFTEMFPDVFGDDSEGFGSGLYGDFFTEVILGKQQGKRNNPHQPKENRQNIGLNGHSEHLAIPIKTFPSIILQKAIFLINIRAVRTRFQGFRAIVKIKAT
jgi:hypothetical protein